MHISTMLVFWSLVSLVRNSVVLAVYLLFSVTCFFTIYEHSRPDCVTEVRRGNTVLVVSGYFKQGTTATAADKMMKVLEAESAAGHKPPFTA